MELQDGLVVESDGVEGSRIGLGQAVAHRVTREGLVVFDAGEALLLRGRDDATVLDQARGCVVVPAADAEDAHQ